MSQLRELAKPFPDKYLGKDDRGNDAVDHTVVTQRLLEVVGPYSMEVREVLRSDVAGMTTRSGKEHPGGTFITGVIVRLHLTIDGREVFIDETGGCENAAMKDGDGERLKHAISDAIKRASMRLSLGLHMWAQGNYYLERSLAQREGGQSAGAESPAASAGEPENPGSGSPSTSSEVGEGEASASEGEPTVEQAQATLEEVAGAEPDDGGPPDGEHGDPAERSSLIGTFHGIVKGAGLDYDRQVRPFLEAHYGCTLSKLPIDNLRALVAKLNSGTQHEKQEARKRFKVAVQEHAEAAA